MARPLGLSAPAFLGLPPPQLGLAPLALASLPLAPVSPVLAPPLLVVGFGAKCDREIKPAGIDGRIKPGHDVETAPRRYFIPMQLA
jgi:hypothetical protein